jgi:hypothetical protein
MSCLVPPGGHTKMDTILTYWQQLTFQIRWEELLWRSHLSRWKWIWIQAITRNSSLRDYAIREVPAQSKPVWMYQWCPTWMNQPLAWTHVLTVWVSHYKVDVSTMHQHCMNLTKATTGYARTLKSNTGYYIHRLVCKDETKMKETAKQACFSSPH